MIFNFWNVCLTNKILVFFFISKNDKKLNQSEKNGMDFASNIDYARKSLSKVMNHCFDKLSSFLHTNEIQSNVSNITEISIEHENELRDDSSCSSTIKEKPLLMSNSKRAKANSSIKESTSETIKTPLNIHKRKHSKQKPFVCDQCPKAFSLKGNLLIHKRIHTGEKPFHCDICQKKFAQSISLIKHKRVHPGEKPYQCELCPKTFFHLFELIVFCIQIELE